MTNLTPVISSVSDVVSDSIAEPVSESAVRTVASQQKQITQGPRAETLALIRLFARLYNYTPNEKHNANEYWT